MNFTFRLRRHTMFNAQKLSRTEGKTEKGAENSLTEQRGTSNHPYKPKSFAGQFLFHTCFVFFCSF